MTASSLAKLEPAPSTLPPGSTAVTRGNIPPLAPNRRHRRVFVALLGSLIAHEDLRQGKSSSSHLTIAITVSITTTSISNSPPQSFETTSMSGYLFVTAPEADHKAVNLILHELSNWGYNDGESDFKVITTKNAYDFERLAGSYMLEVTLPDLDSTFGNAWAGSNLKDVEDFCLEVLRGEDSGADAPSLFVVVDAAGFEGRNAIVVERAIDEEDEDFKELDSFVKMRIPWDEFNSVWCNLHIANMSFEEFGEPREDDEDDGAKGKRVDGESGKDGWHDYEPIGGHLKEKNAKKKEKALQRLKDDGRT